MPGEGELIVSLSFATLIVTKVNICVLKCKNWYLTPWLNTVLNIDFHGWSVVHFSCFDQHFMFKLSFKGSHYFYCMIESQFSEIQPFLFPLFPKIY